MTWLLATFKVQEGKQAEFESVMRDLMKEVHANEPDVPVYQLVKSKKEANKYVMIERYATAEARKAHGETAYFKAAMPKFMACLEGALELNSFEAVTST